MRTKITIRLEEEVHTALKVKTAAERLSIQEVAERLLKDYIARPSGKKRV